MGRDFSTGQVAKMLGLGIATIIRACDRGEIDHYKVPRRKSHRRIPPKALLKYLRQYHVPAPKALADAQA